MTRATISIHNAFLVKDHDSLIANKGKIFMHLPTPQCICPFVFQEQPQYYVPVASILFCISLVDQQGNNLRALRIDSARL